ncbi:MAG: helix-turn-helix domain-containing protein [bacterium]
MMLTINPTKLDVNARIAKGRFGDVAEPTLGDASISIQKTMKQNQLLAFLSEIGMNENEAKTYLALLSLGPTTILKLAQAAEIKRTTAYSVVESLKQKGLIKIEVKGFKKFFVAENPKKLDVMLELKREQMKQLLPEFLALQNLSGEENFIKYYEGLKAVKNVYEEILKEMKPHEEYLSVGNPVQWFPLDADYFQDFMERRAKLSRKLNFKIRLILKDSKKAHVLKKYEKNYNEEIKLLPPRATFSSNLIIVPKKIIIHQLIPPVRTIIIENKSAVQLQREMFNTIWEAI